MPEAVLPALHMSNMGVKYSGMVLRPDECVPYRSRHTNTGEEQERDFAGNVLKRRRVQSVVVEKGYVTRVLIVSIVVLSRCELCAFIGEARTGSQSETA